MTEEVLDKAWRCCPTCGHPVRVVGGEDALHYEPVEPKALAAGWTAKGVQEFGDWDFVSEGKHWLVSEEQEYKDDVPVSIIEREP